MHPNSSKFACNSTQIEPFEYRVFVRRTRATVSKLASVKNSFYFGTNQEPNSQACVSIEM
jgi:hypothetical protein